MKQSLSLAVALAAIALSNSAFAYSPKTSETLNAVSTVRLVPSKVVSPSKLPLTFTREVVKVEFSLDTTGQPHDVKVLSNADRTVKEQVVKAFKQWKFEPVAGSDTQRYVLPLEIVPEA